MSTTNIKLSDFPLWTALVTPLNEQDQVDYASLAKILQQQNEARNGILILGSTGEALNLSLKERKEILTFVFKQKLEVPVMCGVGGSEIEATCEWVQYLETLPIHAYLMVVPHYAKPEAHGQEQWFRKLMNLSTRPVMLYNVPSRTGKALSYEAIKRLGDHPRLWALKEASGSVSDFGMYRESAPNVKVYSGDDSMLPAYVPLDAQGLVSVASNVWPKATHKYVELSLAKKLSEQDKTMWQRCSEALFCASNPIPVKALMAKKGMIATAQMRLPLHHADLKDLARLVQADQEIEQWIKNQ